MIIANKNGWLVAAELITETPSKVVLRPFDGGRPITVKKDDSQQKIFSNVKDAMVWIKDDQ